MAMCLRRRCVAGRALLREVYRCSPSAAGRHSGACQLRAPPVQCAPTRVDWNSKLGVAVRVPDASLGRVIEVAPLAECSHFVNLTNGLEALPTFTALGLPYQFCRCAAIDMLCEHACSVINLSSFEIACSCSADVRATQRSTCRLQSTQCEQQLLKNLVLLTGDSVTDQVQLVQDPVDTV